MSRMMTVMILAGLFGAMATAGRATDFKDYPDRWRCAYSYNGGGRAVWVYGDTIQWKPDAIASARSACRARSANCVSLGCFKSR